ncbi:bifunctional oligoribonuclease/PAP phosphatase NrnA [Marinilactibacillus sp. XAAS-LB27]|uniref:DHH family phosphoesterase n=1 Tax=Marinilactibacillus sp. XAAS-LB27 TaxID=3114538 RepID=UPI002E17424F|nr:bifunctional oligoribonuclease/PAP phosphatase NrnA [Marinilactibacillus sp. XAAS-LB27]
MTLKSMNKEDYDTKLEILNTIKKWETIIIHRHERPDPDALGSQCGLAELIKGTYPDKKVYTAGFDNDNLAFLQKMDPPKKEDYTNALVIVTDTANVKRIDGKAFDLSENWIKIDHHPLDDSYGDIEWVNTEASSCSEMIADFWLTFKDELVMTTEAARLLYAGIVGDTNRFLYSGTSSYTMQIGAELMKFPFSHTALNNKMNVIKPPVAKLMGYVLENFSVNDQGVGHIILTQETLESMNIGDKDTNGIVSLPGSIEGVKAWGIFVQQVEGHYRCRLRSKGPVINVIAKQHDGGGHPLASGANAKDESEIEQILGQMTEAAEQWTPEIL